MGIRLGGKARRLPDPEEGICSTHNVQRDSFLAQCHSGTSLWPPLLAVIMWESPIERGEKHIDAHNWLQGITRRLNAQPPSSPHHSQIHSLDTSLPPDDTRTRQDTTGFPTPTSIPTCTHIFHTYTHTPLLCLRPTNPQSLSSLSLSLSLALSPSLALPPGFPLHSFYFVEARPCPSARNGEPTRFWTRFGTPARESWNDRLRRPLAPVFLCA